MNTNKILPANFIHANGFMPKSYTSLFNSLKSSLLIKEYLLTDIKTKKQNLQLENWIPIYEDFIKTTENQNEKFIGIGHSIGGNIILRSALMHPEKFRAIILLDPTLFIPQIIFFWRIFKFFRLHNKLHPFLKSTLNRKMSYQNFNTLFDTYREKNIFSKINDENLTFYIESISKQTDNGIEITYPKDFEYDIYNTGLVADNYIWGNLHCLNIPTLILRAEYSNAFLPSAEKKVKNINKKIKLITLKGTTHLFPLERPNKTSDYIKRFLEPNSQ